MTIPLQCLLVEDSESDAAIIIRLLEKADFKVQAERVESSNDMQTALTRQPWDIIIADYCLPGFDGGKALRVLKESGRDIPFISVSGQMGEETAVEMMKQGAADYLTKNHLERLASAV
ncbi:MAG: response regulator, partial [Candidatus Riflebacteria bacterium]|nr:response regulator [Candidatus Riflebacteria bacterium]